MNYNKNYIQYISGIINEETYRLRENYDQDTKVYAFKNNDEITFKNPYDNNKIKGKIIEIKVDHEPHTNQEMPQHDETVLKVDSEGKIVSITIGEIDQNDPMLRIRRMSYKNWNSNNSPYAKF